MSNNPTQSNSSPARAPGRDPLFPAAAHAPETRSEALNRKNGIASAWALSGLPPLKLALALEAIFRHLNGGGSLSVSPGQSAGLTPDGELLGVLPEADAEIPVSPLFDPPGDPGVLSLDQLREWLESHYRDEDINITAVFTPERGREYVLRAEDGLVLARWKDRQNRGTREYHGFTVFRVTRI